MSQLPKGWIEITIGDVLQPQSDGKLIHQGWSPKCHTEAADSDDWGVLKTTAIQDGFFLEEHNKKLPEDKQPRERIEVNPGDLLMTNAGPRARCGITTLVQDVRPKLMLSGKMYRMRFNQNYIYPRFIEACLRSEKVRAEIDARKTGMSESGLNLTQARFLTVPFRLAPLNEQIRIANKLDSILAKVDKAQARLNKIPAILKRFRQSVLAAATSGELTKAWRESKDLHWEVTSFGKLIKNGPQNGIYKPSKLYGSGTKIIRIDGFYDGKLSPWESIKSVQLENDELAKWKLKVDDILINRVNSIEYLGKCGHVDYLPEDAVFESNIMRVELDKSLANPLFIKHFLSSPIGLMRLRANAKHAVNQASINQTDVKSVEIHLPNIEEQKLIVELVEAFLDKANKVEKQYLDAKARLDRLTQSILAKAFRGELVPQDPTDEPAEQLLERILKERGQVAPKKTTRKRTTKAKTAGKG